MIGMSRKPKQKMRTLQYLLDFGSITNFEAYEDLGITRVSARICELRKEGYPIVSTSETRLNRYGETTRYTRYRMAS